jgi:hypothetical protein
MPTIGVANPFEVGMGAAENQFNAQQAQKDLELRRQRELEKQQFDEKTRTHELANDDQRVKMAQAKNEADIAQENQQTKIAADVEAARKKMEPLLLEHQQLQNKKDAVGVLDAKEQLRLDRANASLAELKTKEEPQVFHAAMQQAQANLQLTAAQTASSYASANYENAAAAHVGDRVGKGSASDQAAEEESKLSPRAQEIWGYLNQMDAKRMTPALAQLVITRQNPPLPPADQQALMKLVTGKTSPVLSAAGRAAALRAEQNTDTRGEHYDAAQARGSGDRAFNDLTSHLPPSMLSQYGPELSEMHQALNAGHSPDELRKHLEQKAATDQKAAAFLKLVWPNG